MQEDNGLKTRWEETQSNWDDTDFLLNKANALMKKRWLRLNKTIADIIGKEVVRRNEYINLLDIGAGRGDFFKSVQGIVKKYTGIEPSFQMLKNEIFENDFVLKRGKGEELEEENAFDVVLIKEVLDHCFIPEKVIANAHKALKADGVVIITLTNKDAYYKKIFKNYAKQLEQEHKDHLFNFNPPEVETLMKKAGFTVEKTLSTNYMRLPFKAEELIGKMPDSLVFRLLDITDAMARIFLKNKGGSFIVTGRKSGQ
jgi:2-polyprenyl-3-methyl-5-hydroxy-6-metoxy-1,4-benzoquinol methylase